jgi:hypothetical protein
LGGVGVTEAALFEVLAAPLVDDGCEVPGTDDNGWISMVFSSYKKPKCE